MTRSHEASPTHILHDVSSVHASERLHAVIAVQETIDQDRVRVQIRDGQAKEMWGIVWWGKLPLLFKAWRAFPSRRPLPLSLGNMEKTDWSAHAPYTPTEFSPSLNTTPLQDNDYAYMLRGMGIKEKAIRKHEEEKTLRERFHFELAKREKVYGELRKLRSDNDGFRRIVGTAVVLTCNEIEERLKNSEQKE